MESSEIALYEIQCRKNEIKQLQMTIDLANQAILGHRIALMHLDLALVP